MGNQLAIELGSKHEAIFRVFPYRILRHNGYLQLRSFTMQYSMSEEQPSLLVKPGTDVKIEPVHVAPISSPKALVAFDVVGQ